MTGKELLKMSSYVLILSFFSYGKSFGEITQNLSIFSGLPQKGDNQILIGKNKDLISKTKYKNKNKTWVHESRWRRGREEIFYM